MYVYKIKHIYEYMCFILYVEYCVYFYLSDLEVVFLVDSVLTKGGSTY